MTNKTAIVTGGASGIGLAIASVFTRNNIFTIIIGRDQQKLSNAKQQPEENCRTVSYDLSDLRRIQLTLFSAPEEHTLFEFWHLFVFWRL